MSPSPPKLRVATLDDYPRIVHLEAEYGLNTKGYEEWKHLWEANPLYQELQRDWPIGWVLENGDKQIVASLGNIPLLYEFQGKRIIVATGRAWVADPRYRSYSILLLDQFFSQAGVDLFLNFTLSARASEAFSIFQPLPVPGGRWDESLFWVTHHRGFVKSSLLTKGVPLPEICSYPASAALFVREKLKSRALPAQSKILVEPCEHFDDRFQIFWDTLRSVRRGVLMASRARDVLDWHFKHALVHGKAWVLSVNEGPRLLAYAIFSRKDNRKAGLKRVRLTDFQCLDRNPELLLPMLGHALRKCRAERIHMLESIGCSEKTKVMEGFAPYRRKLPSWLYFYKAKDPRFAGTLRDPQVWDPSAYDGDASL